MKNRVLVTAALPYANGSIHFGHVAGVLLAADIFSRFQRLQKADVIYISGSDEYGVAIELSALQAGFTPTEQVNKYYEINKKILDALKIKFDFFGRTTDRYHDKNVIEIFETLKKNGYMEEKTEEHLFSSADNRFLADRYVVGTCPKCGFEAARGDECTKCCASFDAIDLINPRSKFTDSPLERRESTHWYMRFDSFKERLEKFLDNASWNPGTVAFAKSYLKDIKPRAITRDSAWGIPVPDRDGKVFYVWFDAPISYISFTKELFQDEDRFEKYWKDKKTRFVQFLGKDNIPFHAIFFPAMLMGLNKNYNVVDELIACQFLRFEGSAFSKSDGSKIDINYFINNYSSDQIRYYLVSVAPETADTDFVLSEFIHRCNKDLLGKFGNFVNRVITFCHKHFEGKVPASTPLMPEDQKFLSDMELTRNCITKCYDEASPRRAVRYLMELASLGNSYFDHKRPWAIKKSAALTINLCLNCIRLLACLSKPILVDTSEKIWHFLGYRKTIEEMEFNELFKDLEVGTKLNDPVLLFRKCETQLA